MKKLLSLFLALLLTAGSASAFADDTKTVPGIGYQFDFTIQLHTDAFSPLLREHMQGYADMLDALRFQGVYAYGIEKECFDLHLTIAPTDARAEPITIRLHGREDDMYLNSSLLGEETITLSIVSMLDFCSKIYAQMGIPLHYLALMYPYNWYYGLKMPIDDWHFMVDTMDANGVISKSYVDYLLDCWGDRIHTNQPLRIFLSSLGTSEEFQEDIQAVATEIPTYFHDIVALGEEIHVIRDGDQVIWRAASGDFFTTKGSENYQEMILNLPKMRSGYLPSLYITRTIWETRQSARLIARIKSTSDLAADLLDLQVALTSLPVSWPDNCQSLINLNLTGGMLPNLGMSVFLSSEESGHATLQLRKPDVGDEPGPVMATIDGFLTPMAEEVPVPEFTCMDGVDTLDLFVSNDSSFGPFVAKVVEPVVRGMLGFLVGIPVSSCQVIIDDLTEAGVLSVLLDG